jgi:hypothetical protein
MTEHENKEKGKGVDGNEGDLTSIYAMLKAMMGKMDAVVDRVTSLENS